ncbi:MAG: coenzyme F420-0:L-glutamate ligase [Methanobacterium sp.]
MKTNEYKVIPVKTSYIKPNESYDIIIENSKDLVKNGDFLVISETPISISQGRLVDESLFKPSLLAIFLTDIWSKYLWGYILGPLFGIKKRTINNLRKLPAKARSHKEVVLKYYGIKHALKPASEAGIDLSNAPGTYVSLLPDKPSDVALDIAGKISNNVGKEVIVVIIDTDATYEFRDKLLTSLPIAADGIKSDLGIFGYVLGRFGKIKGPTPLGVSRNFEIEEIMKVAKIADDYQTENENNMATVYDMKDVFDGEVDGVTIDMLSSIEHMPAVIVRKH